MFLAFDNITLEEYQPWKSPVQLQSSKPRLLTSPWARGLSRLASCFPQSFIVSGSSSALNVSATAFDRVVGDHADLPLGPLALSSVQHATLTRLPCGRVSLASEAVFRRGGWTFSSVLSFVTSGRAGPLFQRASGAVRQRIVTQTKEVRSSIAT